jgi:hypothetical protein
MARVLKPIERITPEVIPHTEEEVEQEIARISVSNDVRGLSGFLETRDANWAERDAALRRLGEMVNAGMLDANSPDFGSLLKALLTGLVAQLPDLRSQVARSACETLRDIEQKVSLSMNLSVTQLADRGLCERIGTILAEYDIEPERLVVEITEHATLQRQAGRPEAAGAVAEGAAPDHQTLPTLRQHPLLHLAPHRR